MMPRRSSVGLVAVLLAIGCGKIIGADFDEAKPLATEGTGGSAGNGEGGNQPQSGNRATSGGTAGTAGARDAAGASGRGGSTTTGGVTSGGDGGMATGGTATGANGGAATAGGGQGGSFGGAGGTATGGDGGGATGGALTGGAPTGGASTGGSSTGGATCDAEALGDVQLVVINETLVGGGTDYVELYNTGTDIADLAGYGVADEDGGAPKFSEVMRFPHCTLIGPGEYLVVLAQQTTAGGPYVCSGVPCYFATWGLKSDGETAFFVAPNNDIIDRAEVPGPTDGGPADGQTWSRIPNGTGPFQLGLPTRGSTNAAVATGGTGGGAGAGGLSPTAGAGGVGGGGA